MAAAHQVTIYGTAVMVCAPDGPELGSDTVASDLIGEAIGHRSDLVAVPAERLGADFLDPSGSTADRVAQRFAAHQVGLAIVGDVPDHVADSASDLLWFVPTFEALAERLDRRSTPRRS